MHYKVALLTVKLDRCVVLALPLLLKQYCPGSTPCLKLWEVLYIKNRLLVMLLFVSCFSAFPLSFQLPLMVLLKATAEMLNKNFRRSSNPLCYFSKFILISYLAMTSVTFWILFQDSWCGLHFQIKVLEAQCSYLNKITAAPVRVLGGDARGCHSS